ncbi:MAG: hypothetical protein ACK52W_08255, partial [Alphaproteobacteria bacterium]
AVDNRGNLYVYSVSDSLGLVGTTAFNTTGAATAKAAIEKLGESNIFNRDIINEQKLVALRAALQQGLDPNSIVLTPGANGQLRQTPLATYIAENMSGPSRDLALQDLQTAQQNRGQFQQLSAAPAAGEARSQTVAYTPPGAGATQGSPQPTAINVPPLVLNGATVDLKAQASAPLKDRVDGILRAQTVKSANGSELQGNERAAAVLGELTNHVRSAEVKNYATSEEKNAAIAAARAEVKTVLEGVMQDPTLSRNFAAFGGMAMGSQESQGQLQTAITDLAGAAGIKTEELQRGMQQLAAQRAQAAATASGRETPAVTEARGARDAAAAAIVIRAPEGADKATKERATALNQAYKDSLTPPAEGFAGLIQTFVKMIGHAIDPNNPRFMDSDQILNLAKSGGLKIDGEEALVKANQHLATVRQGGTPAAGTPAPAAPATAAAPAPAPATAPASAAPAAATAPAPAPAAAPAAPAPAPAAPATAAAAAPVVAAAAPARALTEKEKAIVESIKEYANVLGDIPGSIHLHTLANIPPQVTLSELKAALKNPAVVAEITKVAPSENAASIERIGQILEKVPTTNNDKPVDLISRRTFEDAALSLDSSSQQTGLERHAQRLQPPKGMAVDPLKKRADSFINAVYTPPSTDTVSPDAQAPVVDKQAAKAPAQAEAIKTAYAPPPQSNVEAPSSPGWTPPVDKGAMPQNKGSGRE